MAELPNQPKGHIEVVAYDPTWPTRYQKERELIIRISKEEFVHLEHIGSTAIPGQRAKPVIDMMGAIRSLEACSVLLEALASLNYQVIETGMRNRLFLRKPALEGNPAFHLHIVEQTTWEERKERMMRDYLLAHPEAVKAYGELKEKLAAIYQDDVLGYTKAKTGFIQTIIDQVRATRGLPPVDVWED